MGPAFLITLREGLEAVLIIAIVLAYLQTLGRVDQFRHIYLGVAIGVGISLLIAILVFVSIGNLQGKAGELTEGFISLLAAGILTWMIFWMRGQSRTIGHELRNKVDSALTKGSMIAMVGVVFIGVLREGIETGLFLIAVFINSTFESAGIGALGGLTTAAAIGYLVYTGSKKINLKLFFQITGGFIILVSAGMLSNAFHEFQEAGIFNIYMTSAWDLTSVPLIGSGQIAIFLKSIVGWRPDPTVGQAFVWLAYLTIATWLFYFAGTPTKLNKPSEK
ncbi:FTR1 family protein [Patescibacteria group bacterium]|nr:FTR1 family protein [Patescibacteria group bacterium]